MFAKLFLLTILTYCVLSAPLDDDDDTGAYHHVDHYPDEHPKYDFKYDVNDAHTGDKKAQQEERDGDVVKGEYSLYQPNGLKRTVHYTSDDKNGFIAHVSYSGEANSH